MFVTFEGIDGVGKSTQAKILASRLRSGINVWGNSSINVWGDKIPEVVLTHEPGGTPFGMRVRQIIKTEPTISLKSQFHLIEAQRAHHIQELIIPALADGKIVICDRFIDTSYVYQHDYMSEWEWQEYLEEYPVVPDLTFLLFSDDIQGLKDRMNARNDIVMDHFDNEPIKKLFTKQQLFSKLSTTFSRIIPINSDRAIEVVADDIWNHYIVNR
jgi:dTMP kinase